METRSLALLVLAFAVGARSAAQPAAPLSDSDLVARAERFVDRLSRGEHALAGRPGTVLRSYPKLDHLLREGEGKSTPADYEEPGHVAAEVIADIAAWIAETGPGAATAGGR